METLKQNWQFRRLYKRKSLTSPLLVSYYEKNKLGYNRIGITTSKKIGKAHDRNRARRVIKEAFRLLDKEAVQGYDFVFVARTKTAKVKMDKVLKTMSEHLNEITKENVKKTT